MHRAAIVGGLHARCRPESVTAYANLMHADAGARSKCRRHLLASTRAVGSVSAARSSISREVAMSGLFVGAWAV
eukprot:scaffold284629_cov36-Tisochrysis_lutea.AAC.3